MEVSDQSASSISSVSSMGFLPCRAIRSWVELLLLFLGIDHVSCTQPLAVKLEGVFDADALRALRSVQAAATASETANPRELLQRRSFGIGADGKEGGGHDMLFLHEHLDKGAPHVRTNMLAWAKKADSIAGWNTLGSTSPSARCFEIISYHRVGSRNDTVTARDNISESENQGSSDDIGWHSDGATLITIAAMLSHKDEYQGGVIELKEGNASERYELSQGDVLAWRGWTQHRVICCSLEACFVFYANQYGSANANRYYV